MVPFGAFVRVADGIEGLVHISELAERHVEIPEQVVTLDQDLFVKVIDIDLERRRISLSLKQANEGTDADALEENFHPEVYGMAGSYDEAGHYQYPEGFDSEAGHWLPGFEKQQAEWEAAYAIAHERWIAHQAQAKEARALDAAAAEAAAAESTYSSASESASDAGTLASDEGLQALKEKLEG